MEEKNDLDYSQNILGAYASYRYKLKKFGIKAGLRAEYAVVDGTFKLQEDYKLSNTNFNIVPYINGSFKISESKTLSAGYTQRLQRPGIWYLNPYIDRENPENISTGNPELNSEIRHAVNLGFSSNSAKLNYSISLSGSYSDNSIERTTTVDDKGVRLSTYTNSGTRQQYGASMYGGSNFFNGKLSFSLNAGSRYSILESSQSNIARNEGFSTNINLNISGQPWKNGYIYFYGGYQSSNVSLQSNSSEYTYHGFGVSQGLLKDKKIRLNIGIRDPFRKNSVYKDTSFGPGFNSTSEWTEHVRSFNFGIQWNFGKTMTQVKKASRGISNDDKMSGSGGGSGSSK